MARERTGLCQFKRRELIATTALVAGLLLTPVLASADDVVMEWNQIALAATVTAGQGPLPQVRTMAIVQVSVHDAVNRRPHLFRDSLSDVRRGRGSVRPQDCPVCCEPCPA